MKLHEIIKANESHTTAVLYEFCAPYLKSLNTYYSRLFCDDVILMVTDVMNACQYVKFVPSGEFTEAINAYLDNGIEEGSNYVSIPQNLNDDDFAAIETIEFNSKFLKDLI